MMKQAKTAHLLYLFCVALLITNDWYFKMAFPGWVTGKLSDFAGLFALPYFLSNRFPRHKVKIHLGVGLLFIFWKSELSGSFISAFNSIGVPIGRTVDPTDNIALISVLFSFILAKREAIINIGPALNRAIVFISCLAFMATSLPPRQKRKYVNIDKEYRFNIPRSDLVSRLNAIQLRNIRKLSRHVQIDFNSETNTFHSHYQKDTLATLLDFNRVSDRDTIHLASALAEMIIYGNEDTSGIRLLTVYKYTPVFKDKDYREKAIRQFEKRIVRKVRGMR